MGQTAAGALAVPAATVLYRGAKSSSTFGTMSQATALQKKAALARLAPAQSALVRQKGVAEKSLLSKVGGLKQAGSGAKSMEMAKFKKAALPAKKLALKDAKALKTLAGSKEKAALKAMSPTLSALVRQKGLAEKSLLSKLGDVKKAEGAAKGTGLAQFKKAALPAKKLALKDAKALKTLAGSKEKAALKAMAPTHSALVRQKSLLGQDLSRAKSTIGKDMSMIKKIAQQSDAAKSAKKVGAVASKAKQKASKSKIARLYRGGN